MSEYISDNASMSDIKPSSRNTENNSTAVSHGKNWVHFDEGDGKPEDGAHKSVSADGTPIRNTGSSSQTTTSGVSSARGSVNSLPQQSHASINVHSSPEGAQLSVSEIQVSLAFRFIRLVAFIFSALFYLFWSKISILIFRLSMKIL